MSALPWLSAEETAARLGIKIESLYAYVARGLLPRERTAGGSRFDPVEVESFAARRTRTSSVRNVPSTGRTAARPLAMLDTDIAFVEDDDLFYRGRRARDLSGAESFESVASWIWGGELSPASFPPSSPVPPLSPNQTLLDRLTHAIALQAVRDPLRYDLDPSAVTAAARRIIAAEAGGVGAEGGGGLALRLWESLSPLPPEPVGVAAVDAALIMLVDHDLAVSTIAARAAASARASIYGSLSAALGAMDSALHGNASRAAVRLLRDVVDGETPQTALRRAIVMTGRSAPGFGQPLYAKEDPRATEVFSRLSLYGPAKHVLEAVDLLAREVFVGTGRYPNIDLALAALTISARMPDDAGPALFAIGRTVGWVAHVMDEYSQKPLRFRPQGRYVGPL